MAVKATCSVTLSIYRDTQSVTRYYKLQSSTLEAPSVPTTNPPEDWTDSEPTYVSDSTNTLYFCDLTAFSDGTWAYSTVSKSSSYEAAKEAYNKADNAQTSADDAKESASSAQNSADAANEQIVDTQAYVEILADTIANLVTDGDGVSLMEQTDNGWTFNIGSINDKLSNATSDLEEAIEHLSNVDGSLDALNDAVNDLGILTDYVVITTYNNQPCIELGEIDSAFKLRITNTEIQFINDSVIPAYITNKKLLIEQAEVKNELQFGGFSWVLHDGNMGLMWKGEDE